MGVVETRCFTIADEFSTLEKYWNDFDYFYLHVKKTDTYGEAGDFPGKVGVIEEVDALLPRLLALDPDVVIVGAGAVGGMAAYKLAQAGVKTLLLEAGPRIDRNAALSCFAQSKSKGPDSPYESTVYAPHPETDRFDAYFINEGPDQFIGTYLRGVGGTTWHFTGFATRLRPSDLRMRTEFCRSRRPPGRSRGF